MCLKMAVDIAVDVDFPFFFDYCRQIFHSVNHRVDVGRGSRPTAVHVETGETGTVVALDYAIWVQHRDNVDYEILPELNCFFVGGEEEIHHAFKGEGGLGFTWVNSGGDNDSLFIMVHKTMQLIFALNAYVQTEVPQLILLEFFRLSFLPFNGPYFFDILKYGVAVSKVFFLLDFQMLKICH